jgi:phosphohistidine swiveling domain-containing protein
MTSSAVNYACPDGSDFPVEWPTPDLERYGWRWDQMHCPLPLTPLSEDWSDDIGEGFARAGRITGAPAYQARFQAHGYRFTRSTPFTDDATVRRAIMDQDVSERVDRVLEMWEDSYRPETEALTRSLRTWADGAQTPAQLVGRLDQVHAARIRQGELHALVMGMAAVAANRFLDWCTAEIGVDGEQAGLEMLQGFPNKSLESADALWSLSREALARPAVADLLRRSKPAEFLIGVDATTGGQEFYEALAAFLGEYGHRNESFSELSLATWTEDPRFPLFLVRRFLDVAEDASPKALHARTVARRVESVAQMEGPLTGDSGKLRTFRRFLESGQQRTVLLEDHNFFIDQQGFVAARRPALALGEALTRQGAINQVDDVFYLRDSEVREAAARPGAAFQSVVALRRAERDRWLRVLPPTEIGAGAVASNPGLDRFFGTFSQEPAPPGTIVGIAGSPGTVRGVARLIMTLDEVDRLGPGEILVTYATAPPWTPLFGLAVGVVTDAGGVLSHCAIVAREYGIPAVVGARTATAQIEDGMLITVDGTRGIVTVEQ